MKASAEKLSKAFAQARALFKAFHKRVAAPRYIRVLGMTEPVVALEVGQLVSLVYKPVGDNTTYDHAFNKHKRPTLMVSADGREMFILGGVYKFGDRGFDG